jgi:ubiquinone/menaquinone biosynthesis C-methylase UbiE/uncharacterized protein YbaR (Trm112 family)
VKYRAVDLLRCPYDRASLTLRDAVTRPAESSESFDEGRSTEGVEVTAGRLTCSVCSRSWEIVRGIPRLFPDELAEDVKKAQDTFSHEWKMFKFGERNWGQDIGHRRELFLDALGASPEELRGKLIFDAGCGSGLLSMEMARTFGMEVLALDLAFGIEQAYEHNKNPYVYFVQGSVLDPPVATGTFDYLYCAGVLVATPDTHEGFKKIVGTLKPGGRCFIWVYHPITEEFYGRSWRKLAVYNWIRVHVTSRLPIKVQSALYLSLMPLFWVKQSIERLFGRRETRLTWREKMQALFDFFSPRYQHRHDPDEVTQWFHEAGFDNVAVCNIGAEGFGVRGDLVARDESSRLEGTHAEPASRR